MSNPKPLAPVSRELLQLEEHKGMYEAHIAARKASGVNYDAEQTGLKAVTDRISELKK